MMDESGEEKYNYLTRRNVSAAVIVSVIALYFPAKQEVVGWLDDRYARKNETVTLAQRDEILSISKQALNQANSNSSKIDMVNFQLASLRVQSAVTVASALQGELDQLEARHAANGGHREEISKLKRRVEQAIAYRDCLWEERSNCENIRGY